MNKTLRELTCMLKHEYNISCMIHECITGGYMVYTFSQKGYYYSMTQVLCGQSNYNMLRDHCIYQGILEEIAWRLRKSLNKH